MRILENISLSPYTTFRIGGPARFISIINSTDDLLETLSFAREKKLPIFILGGGSNILVSDKGFDGVVIKNEIKGIDIESEDASLVTVNVGAGENWDDLVEFAVAHGWGGIENLSLIPGTVGAAPVQNIGAYGSEVKDTIVSVKAVALSDSVERIFTNQECQFEYRDSLFKKNNDYVITHVVFRLTKNSTKTNISYKDLKEFFAGRDGLTIKDVRDAVIKIRTAKLPDIKIYGTAGSFFKNPVITTDEYAVLKDKYPDLPSFPYISGKVKVPLAWILDHICGFKGVKKGNVGTYKNQALVIVNDGGASASEVSSLANDMIQAVKRDTGIDIEKEVQYVGF